MENFSESGWILLTVEQIAEIYGLDPFQITTWIEQGSLKAQLDSAGRRGVAVADLKSFLKANGILTVADSVPKFKIMVVDDDQEIRQSMMRQLIRAWPQSRVDEASTGAQGVRKILQTVPDVVILDVVLPIFDAFNVLTLLRGEPKMAKTRVVAITGFDTPGQREKVLAAGAHAYLAKPFDPLELISIIGNLLAERREE